MTEMAPAAGMVQADGHALETLWIPAVRPDRPPLVLLHEGLGSVALWRDVPARLAVRTGAAVLAYSRWGHGASDPLDGPRRVDYMHDEALRVLPEVLAAFGLDSPVLVGHSDGASIALIHAATGRWRTRGLVLMAPHVFVEDVTVASIAAIGASFRASDMARRMARYHRDPEGMFRGWNDIWLHPDFRAWNIEAGLEHISAPVLMIQGVDDEYGTLAQLAAIRARVAGPVTECVLPACGHAPHKDQPEATLDAIARFVDAL